MNPSVSPPAPRGRRRGRYAAVLGVVGAFLLSSGLVLISQSTAQSAANPKIDVEVCHATGSDSNPYNDLTVNANAGGVNNLGGHLDHLQHPTMTWKSDGVWNGSVHHAGDVKRDYIHSYTDANGVLHDFGDDAFFARGGCNSNVLSIVTPGVTWIEPNCTTAAGFTGADTAHIDYAVTAGSLGNGTTVTVTATAHAGFAFPSGSTTQDFTHTFNSYDPKTCAPPTTVTPNVAWTEPTCTRAAGFTGTDTADIDYAITAGSLGNGTTVTVTATAHPGFQFPGGVTTKAFTHTFNSFDPARCGGGGPGPGGPGPGGPPPGNPPPGNPPPNNPPPVVAPPTTVTVVAPVFADPSCSAPDGAAVRLPGMNARSKPVGPITLTSVLNGITYAASGLLGPHGTVTVTATPGAGTTLAPGSTTTWTHTFPAVSCPAIVDHPVANAPAQLPTFVESGLAPRATTETVVPTGRLRAWGVGLTALGGLVVAGAFWLGLGRRRRGVAV